MAIGHCPFGEFIGAHHQGCFVCYGRNFPFQHDHGTCPTHKANTEAYEKAHESKKRAPAHVLEARVEVSTDDLSKQTMVGSELAKKIQEIKRAWAAKQDKDKHKDKDGKGKGRWRKKGDALNEVTAQGDTLTTEAP